MASGCTDLSRDAAPAASAFPELEVVGSRIEEARVDGNRAELVPIPEYAADGSIAIARDGSIAVVQQQDRAVLFFSEAGVSLGAVGRAGEGPAEFRAISRIGWLADTLWVWDPRLRRITLLDQNYEQVRTITVGQDPFVDTPNANVAGLPFRSYGVVALKPDGTTLAYGDIEHDSWVQGYVRVTPAGIPEKLIAPVHDRDELERTTYSSSDRELSVDPFETGALSAVSPAGDFVAVVRTTLTGKSDSIDIVAVSTVNGDTLLHRKYAFLGTPISTEAADSARSSHWQNNPTLARLYRDHAYIPPVYPPVRSVVVAQEGSVWLELHGPTESEQLYLVQEITDERRGRIIRFPGSPQIAAVRGETAWAIERDTFGVPSLVRFSLDPANTTIN